MSDETPVPCGWCGKQPTLVPYGKGTVFSECDCLGAPEFNWVYNVDEWNKLQRKIVAARRKDYEAGYVQGYKDSERCDEDNGFAAWNDYLARGGE